MELTDNQFDWLVWILLEQKNHQHPPRFNDIVFGRDEINSWDYYSINYKRQQLITQIKEKQNIISEFNTLKSKILTSPSPIDEIINQLRELEQQLFEFQKHK